MSDDLASPGTLRLRETEERMRRALGLSNDAPSQGHRAHAEPPRHKRRFVTDGEVPVTVLPASGANGRRHATEDHERFEAERHAREAAERASSEAQSTIRDLRTRLAHAEIALKEAQDALAAERQRAVETSSELQQVREKLSDYEARAAAQETTQAEQKIRRTTPGRRGRPAAVDPKPVRWWVKPRKLSKR